MKLKHLLEGIECQVLGLSLIHICLKKGIMAAAEAAVEALKELSKPIEGKEAIEQVASVSANDANIGHLIAQAMEKVGNEGEMCIRDRGCAGIALRRPSFCPCRFRNIDEDSALS